MKFRLVEFLLLFLLKFLMIIVLPFISSQQWAPEGDTLHI